MKRLTLMTLFLVFLFFHQVLEAQTLHSIPFNFDLDQNGHFPYGAVLSPSGDVVGSAPDSSMNYIAYTIFNGQVNYYTPISGSPWADLVAHDMNSSGRFIGVEVLGLPRAVVGQANGEVAFLPQTGMTSLAIAVNEAGYIAGEDDNKATIWAPDNSIYSIYKSLDVMSQAHDINSNLIAAVTLSLAKRMARVDFGQDPPLVETLAKPVGIPDDAQGSGFAITEHGIVAGNYRWYEYGPVNYVYSRAVVYLPNNYSLVLPCFTDDEGVEWSGYINDLKYVKSQRQLWVVGTCVHPTVLNDEPVATVWKVSRASLNPVAEKLINLTEANPALLHMRYANSLEVVNGKINIGGIGIMADGPRAFLVVEN